MSVNKSVHAPVRPCAVQQVHQVFFWCGPASRLCAYCATATASQPDEAQNCTCTDSLPTYSLRLYNGLVERCFCECVDEFRRRELNTDEEKVRCASLGIRRDAVCVALYL